MGVLVSVLFTVFLSRTGFCFSMVLYKSYRIFLLEREMKERDKHRKLPYLRLVKQDEGNDDENII